MRRIGLIQRVSINQVWGAVMRSFSDASKKPGIRCAVVNNRFVSPWADKEPTYWNLLTWQYAQLKKNEGKLRLKLPKLKSKKSQKKNESIQPVEVDRELLLNTKQPHLTWIGHSTCLFQMNGLYILTDPIWSKRASPFTFAGPMRSTDPGIEVEDLPVDVVLLSHTHYDHFDSATAQRIGNRALWVVPLGVKEILADLNITNCVELDWWESHSLMDKTGKPVEITLTPARHWTARTPFDKNKCLWGSFAVVGSKRMFFAGDTAYCTDLFRTIGELYGPFDLSLIPIGAYRPRELMKYNHCDPSEAVEIHKDIGSRQSIAIHWGTFLLADDEDVEAAFELGIARTKAGLRPIDFCTMAMGETLLLGDKSKHDMVEKWPEAASSYTSKLEFSGEPLPEFA